MAKPLPMSDFRATRHVLEPHEYATGGEEVPPTDLIEPDIWYGIMHLPDDIAIRISDHHGKQFKLLHALWGHWIESTGSPIQNDDLFSGMLDAADCFQCAIFNFLHGYYRSSMADLRSALELVAIGTYGNLRPNDPLYIRWKSGSADLNFPSCRKRLYHAVRDKSYAAFLSSAAWPNKLYYDLCRYTHSRPDANDGVLWESNGPVYNGYAIRLVYDMNLSVYATCYLLAKIARPKLQLPSKCKILFEFEWLPGHADILKAFNQLYA